MNKVRMGMVGGGPGAFIGAVHRSAAALDGEIELVCGSFSRDPARSRQTGQALGLSAERIYGDYPSMIVAEAALPASDRMEFVAIVTPNNLHYPVAEKALRNGFHVFCEKPATLDVGQAMKLREAVVESGCSFGLAHAYIGYPMVQEARARVAAGELGDITRVLVEYTQGWLSSAAVGTTDLPLWRLDASQAGASCTMGDIGVHASNIAESVHANANRPSGRIHRGVRQPLPQLRSRYPTDGKQQRMAGPRARSWNRRGGTGHGIHRIGHREQSGAFGVASSS